MANYIVSYDLNGPTPSHAQMDDHMGTADWARGRILETVWYVGAPSPLEDVFNHVNAILSNNDQLVVIEATDAHFRNLLIPDESLQAAWAENA